MSGGQKTIESSKKEDKAPWEPAQPYFRDLYGKTQTALNETNKNPFLGDFIAGPAQGTLKGIDLLQNNPANAAIPGITGGYMNMVQDTAAGKYLDPATNPTLMPMVNAATRPLTQNFTNTVLPGLSDQAIMQGAYAGSGMFDAKRQAADDLQRQIGDISANIFYNNYQNERQNQINAPTMAGQMYDISQLPGKTMLNIGDLQRQIAQSKLDNERQKFMELKTAPWYGLGEAAQILSQGGFSTVTGNYSQANPNYVDPFTNALKIGLGGLSTVASAGSGGGFGWWGK